MKNLKEGPVGMGSTFGENTPVGASITIAVENSSGIIVACVLNRAGSCDDNSKAHAAVSKNCEALDQAGPLGSAADPEAKHRCPSLPGHEGPSMPVPQEINIVHEDDPEAVSPCQCRCLPEIVEGLLWGKPPGSCRLHDGITVRTHSCHDPTDAERIETACDRLRDTGDTLSIDAEWNTSAATGPGTTSPVLLTQICGGGGKLQALEAPKTGSG